MDLQQIGYFLHMEEQEKKERQEKVNVESEDIFSGNRAHQAKMQHGTLDNPETMPPMQR